MVPSATKINEEVLERQEREVVLFGYCLFVCWFGLVSIFKKIFLVGNAARVKGRYEGTGYRNGMHGVKFPMIQ